MVVVIDILGVIPYLDDEKGKLENEFEGGMGAWGVVDDFDFESGADGDVEDASGLGWEDMGVGEGEDEEFVLEVEVEVNMVAWDGSRRGVRGNGILIVWRWRWEQERILRLNVFPSIYSTSRPWINPRSPVSREELSISFCLSIFLYNDIDDEKNNFPVTVRKKLAHGTRVRCGERHGE